MIRNVVEYYIDEFKRIERFKRLLAIKQARLAGLIESFNDEEKAEFQRLAQQARKEAEP